MITRLRNRLDGPLVIIAILAVVLNGFGIWNDQYANSYYTTAVASMMQNFHNFFFVSLDTAGSVTVDKPPVTFWIQTISASIFGLHGWSVILPQALAGVGSVLMIYFLVKPSFGTLAARLAALAFACTPIAVAVSRTNNIDSMLVFTLLLATWMLFKSVKSNRIWSLLGAFAFIGVAFNMKMLQAYMVLPAFYVFYLLAAKGNWKKKLAYLTSATALMIGISVSWAVMVDLTPEDQRPYVGSSETNSVLELAFGYNGLSRLTGNQGGDGGASPADNQGPQMNPPGMNNDSQSSEGDANFEGRPNSASAGEDGGAPGGGAGGMFGTGEAGPLRLFESALSGQASWLIPFVVLACVALLAGIRRESITLKQKETIFWLAWLLPVMAFFSIAGFFHHYYLIMLAPPIAALFGAGWMQLCEEYKKHVGWKAWLLPLAVILTAVFHWFIIQPYDDVIGAGWSIGIAAAGAVLAVVLLLNNFGGEKLYHLASRAGWLILLIGPLYWAFTPIMYGGNSMLPQAGPSSLDSRGDIGNPAGGAMPAFNASDDHAPDESTDGMPSMPPNGPEEGNGGFPGGAGQPSGTLKNGQGGMENVSLDAKTLSYLKENNTGESYLFATTSYQTAAPYIIDEGEAVITMGGFSGSDPVYTAEELKELVTSGKVKYFLISGEGMRGGGSEALQWIQDNGEEIPDEEWQNSSTNDGQNMRMEDMGRSTTLYKVQL